ncbi:MAG TPA: FG-GAP-like repeat-containing protein, partial [Crinalium sp.]
MVTINGNSNNNNLFGTQENDVINAGAGNDTVSGLGGSDTINGGEGDDTLYGGVQPGFSASPRTTKIATSDFTPAAQWGNFNDYPRQVADVNGDGRADIIGFADDVVRVALAKADGTFEVFKNALAGFTPQAGGWNSFNQYPRQVADVNGDGRADVVGFGEKNVTVALGKADGTFEAAKDVLADFTPASNGWSSFDEYPRQLADVNGDGRADIVGFGAADVRVALGKADGTFEPGKSTVIGFTPQTGGWNSFNQFPRQLADVNGDGRADIVGFGGKNVTVALGKTDGTFEAAKDVLADFTPSQSWDSFDKYPRQVADINGDGRADIVGFGDKDIAIAFGKADGTFAPTQVLNIDLPDVFTPQRGGWNSFNQFPRQLADVNGDGRADIIGFGAGNVLVSLAPLEVGIDGDDTLDGGAGADKMFGGIGNDTYIVDNSGDVVTELAGEGTDTVISSIDYVLGNNVENLTLSGTSVVGRGNSLNNVITGNASNNLLIGGDGDDQLFGLAGDDSLVGGAGSDRMVGGVGNDTYVYTAGDTIVEAANEGNDTVFSSTDYTLGANLENLTLTDTAVKGTGNELNNTITGNDAANILDGGAGLDTLIGGSGNDTYLVNDAADIVTEAFGGGSDTVITSTSYTLGANVENVILTGSSRVQAIGNDLNNVLTGNAGVNVINAGAGADTLIGGRGADTMKGGKGADRFVFTGMADKGDRVLDFSKQE